MGLLSETANASPNQGEVQLQLRLGETPIASTFQVSQTSRPLWSVGKICDAGYTVVFKKDGAEILHVASGVKIGDFSRRQGLYVGDFKLRNPSLFKRQSRGVRLWTHELIMHSRRLGSHAT